MTARTERVGFGVALGAHVALFAALSVGFLAAPKPLIPAVPPVDIQLVDEVGLADTAPDQALAEPAPSMAPVIDKQIEAAPARPAATSQPKPEPAVLKQPSVPAKPLKLLHAPRHSGSRLGRDFLKGVVARPSTGTAQAPHAILGPAVEASLAREVLRQLKPHWKAPSGSDAEQLRTELSIRLTRDGAVASVEVLRTTGVTEGNRAQVRLHQEAAVKAVRLAAPFDLPADLYDAWKLLAPVGFDKRLG